MQSHVLASNGVYKFDSSTKWTYLIIGTVGLLFISVVSFLAAREQHFTPGIRLVGIGFAAACIYVLVGTLIWSRRTLEISDTGIVLRDKQQHEIKSLRWLELGKVSERRRLGQLALWDKAGIRRMLIDQQFEKFGVIRSRVLDEYARIFQPGPLPITFGKEIVLNYDAVILSAGLVFWAWAARLSYYQGQKIPALFFAALMILTTYCLLNLYPQLRGPSELREDRLVLRGFFKTNKIYKRDVTSVEITDMSNPQSGTRFSIITVRAKDGRKLKITSKYGSIPELYLTLKSWINR
jgi:hypothetical protein